VGVALAQVAAAGVVRPPAAELDRAVADVGAASKPLAARSRRTPRREADAGRAELKALKAAPAEKPKAGKRGKRT
jgi:hypothetical protein